ncbi:MAG: glycosyltransferase [Lachnospiraceae bacterium]|nr:glycosyltransferase [Lachnospiraceae bacterium]
MKYAGVVVTYNRKEELIKNINSILQQSKKFDRYYIIDNCSTDGTYDYLKEHHILENDMIEFISLPENTGGAGGFYYGLKQAFEDGFDFICMMDDDGRAFDKDTFRRLYDAAEKCCRLEKKLMLNSLVVCDDGPCKLSFGLDNMKTVNEVSKKARDGLIRGLINPFNGTLVTKELIHEIGFPNKDFFVRGDEVDYQSRAVRAGALAATVIDSLYYHPSTELVPMKWRGSTVYFGISSPWKGYYLIRNYVYRLKRDEGITAAVKEFIFQFYGTMKCNPDAKNCIRLFMKGFGDGMTGKLGMRVKPGQNK